MQRTGAQISYPIPPAANAPISFTMTRGPGKPSFAGNYWHPSACTPGPKWVFTKNEGITELKVINKTAGSLWYQDSLNQWHRLAIGQSYAITNPPHKTAYLAVRAGSASGPICSTALISWPNFNAFP